ncbi:MAG: NAD-dependent epimerase/dehydratase family protein [Lachnospiraceae bacterium]|nr:NAD-dependent epimerase/dehydratase family protein [Lachnospiraceae bacterium]
MNSYFKNQSYIEDVNRSLNSVIAKEKLKDKKVLVTGAGGLIGSFITDVLTAAGSQTFVAGRNTAKLSERFSESVSLEYDLTKEILFNEDFDYIIYAAGYGHPAAFVENPIGILTESINGTRRMLDYAVGHCKERLLYVSSGEVYGNIDPMTPRACYPLSKQAGENLCASYKDKYGVDAVAVRLCHTFGPGMSEKDNRVTAQFFRNALRSENIILKSKGEQLRSYLYAADSASAILSVLTSGESGKAIDIASRDCEITIAELAGIIARAAGTEVRFELPDELETKQQSPIKQQLLNDEDLKKIGWSKSFTLSEGCTRTIAVLK